MSVWRTGLCTHTNNIKYISFCFHCSARVDNNEIKEKNKTKRKRFTCRWHIEAFLVRLCLITTHTNTHMHTHKYKREWFVRLSLNGVVDIRSRHIQILLQQNHLLLWWVFCVDSGHSQWVPFLYARAVDKYANNTCAHTQLKIIVVLLNKNNKLFANKTIQAFLCS